MRKFRLQQLLLRSLGISLSRLTGPEFRVAFHGRGNEGSAYYTNDLDDALATGRAMAEHASRHQTQLSPPSPTE